MYLLIAGLTAGDLSKASPFRIRIVIPMEESVTLLTMSATGQNGIVGAL